MAAKPRIAVAVGELRLHAMLAGYELCLIERGRHFASDLAAAKPDLVVLEAVHPSEAVWLAGWLRSQPALAGKPLLLILPFGPAPKAAFKDVRYILKPVRRPGLRSHVGRLLRSSYCKPK